MPEAERKRLEAEQLRADQERQAKIQKLEERLATLRSNLKTVTMQEVFGEYWSQFNTRFLSKPENKTGVIVALLVGLFILWPVLIFALPVALPLLALALFQRAKQRTAELNSTTDSEIASISQQLAALGSGGVP